MQFGDLRRCSAPNIDTGGETYDKIVLFRPIHQVEVVVVFEGRGVKHLERYLGDLALLGLRHDHVVLIEATEGRLCLPKIVIIIHIKRAFLFDWIKVLSEWLHTAQLLWDFVIDRE